MRFGKTISLLLGGVAVYLIWNRRRYARNRYYFLDKSVLITGGSRGLGLALARAFLKEGANVALCGRNPESLEKAKVELKDFRERVAAIPCDITDSLQVNAMIQEVRNHFGRIDVVVNNAGIMEVGPMETMTHKDYEDAMKTHFWGTVYVTLAALPYLREHGSARIVNITSIGGKISVPHMLPYTASKFAQVGFSEGLRAELAKNNIAVTTVIPGPMRTGSPINALFKGRHRSEFTWFVLADSLPIFSVSAERAARRIVRACKAGTPEIILTLPAAIAVRLANLAPSLTSYLMEIVNRFLPSDREGGIAAFKGRDSGSRLSSSLLTRLTERAAQHNNEI